MAADPSQRHLRPSHSDTAPRRDWPCHGPFIRARPKTCRARRARRLRVPKGPPRRGGSYKLALTAGPRGRELI